MEGLMWEQNLTDLTDTVADVVVVSSQKSSWFHCLKAWKLFLLILSDQVWKISTAFFTGMNEKPIFWLQKSTSRLLTRTMILLL